MGIIDWLIVGDLDDIVISLISIKFSKRKLNITMEKDIIEILTKIAPDLYEDALQPAFKEAGRILANTISFVGIPFAGLGYLSQKTDMYFKNNLKKYAELLEKVPIDNRQEPLLEISVPIVQKFCYTSTDEIARMFNALLVGASDTRQQQNVFPSFF